MKNAGIQETEKVVVMTGASGGIGRALLETWRNEDARLYLVGRHGAKTLRDLLAADRESRAFQNAKVFAADLAPAFGAALDAFDPPVLREVPALQEDPAFRAARFFSTRS